MKQYRITAVILSFVLCLSGIGCSTVNSESEANILRESEAEESVVRTMPTEDKPAPLYLIEVEPEPEAPDEIPEVPTESILPEPEPEPVWEPEPEPAAAYDEPVVTEQTEPTWEPTEEASVQQTAVPDGEETGYLYVLNTNSMKIHYADCSSVKSMKESNKSYTNDYAGAIAEGYEPCGNCKP